LHVTQNWNSSSSSRLSGFLGSTTYISIISLLSISSFSLVSINASLLRPPVNKAYISFFVFWWICKTIYYYSKRSIFNVLYIVTIKTPKHIHYKRRCTLWKQPELFNIKTIQDFQQRNKLKLTLYLDQHIYIYIYTCAVLAKFN